MFGDELLNAEVVSPHSCVLTTDSSGKEAQSLGAHKAVTR